ncbi:hypothetical protein ACIRO1_45425 [Streptomyces sp. NPDC102381]|uniref:hypothetical protein n=1 Tax=Streptomyces sp. NPDC102381 TaxID=3366164 RepID=UPI0037FB0BFA
MTIAKDQAQLTEWELAGLRAGDVAAAGLREALTRVGIVLPSLLGGFPVQGNGRVELGGCNAGVATTLAEVLNAAADALPELRVSATDRA